MRRRGFVLVVVLFFAVLLMSSIAAFLRRSTIDSVIARNRDFSARAEAAARGGVRLAVVFLLQDLLLEQGEGPKIDSESDVWARPEGFRIETPDGGLLRLRIEDAGARLNLNALFEDGQALNDEVEVYLTALLGKVIDEMPGRPEEKAYDPEELTRNLVDFLDQDDAGQRGEREGEWYSRQEPPYAPNDGPLLSVDELALVRGFDSALLEALRPYVTVYPFVGGAGINVNTAPSWVLAILYHGQSGDQRLATEDVVRDVTKVRSEGRMLCGDTAASDRCDEQSTELLLGAAIVPEPTYHSDVFLVEAVGRYGEIERTITAVVDRSKPAEPRLLAWRVR